MNKQIVNLLNLILLSLIVITFVCNINIVVMSTNESLNIFIKNIFPTLFPFFILSDILYNYNYFYYLQKIFILKYSNLIIFSLVSGLPSNAKYIKNLLDNKVISVDEASNILSCTFFPNPMFVIGGIGTILLNKTIVGIRILLIIYVSNFILYIFKYKSFSNININIFTSKKNFFLLIKESIIKNIETLFIIMGTITIFNTICNI